MRGQYRVLCKNLPEVFIQAGWLHYPHIHEFSSVELTDRHRIRYAPGELLGDIQPVNTGQFSLEFATYDANVNAAVTDVSKEKSTVAGGM